MQGQCRAGGAIGADAECGMHLLSTTPRDLDPLSLRKRKLGLDRTSEHAVDLRVHGSNRLDLLG
jgi:hypothetical protein